MTCLLISSNFPPVTGGSSVVYRYLSKHARGQICVLTASVDYRTGLALGDPDLGSPDANVRVYRTRLLRPMVKGNRSILLRIFDLLVRDIPLMMRVFFIIARIARREQAKTLCIGDLVYLGWLTLPARRLLGLKIIHYIHGEEITDRSGSGILAGPGLKAFHLRRADAIVAVSEFARRSVTDISGIELSRITVIANGVDCEKFNCRARRPDLVARWNLANRKVVVTVGRLIERKGFDRTIEAMAILHRKFPDARYVVVGAGPYRETLAALVTKLGLTDAVCFAGAVPDDDLPDYYALADVFAMPNRTLKNGDTEGFGLVFLEANACGIPVIGGNAGGVPEAIVDGETGFIVDGNDVIAIADAIGRIFSDSTTRSRMSAAALAHAQRNGWQNRADQFLDLCDKVEALRAARPRVPETFPLSSQSVTTGLGGTGTARLIVTIDAEEEFDWSAFSRDNQAVKNIAAQGPAQTILERHGHVPTYLVDYPVAAHPAGYEPLLQMANDGRCIIGAQLHTWVTPPFDEELTVRNTFAKNLPGELERAKVRAITERIAQSFGAAPRVFRAGRYGVGQHSVHALAECGYLVDLSVLPLFNFHRGDGPNFRDPGLDPYWLAPELLEIPSTVGLVGFGARHLDGIYSWLDGAAPSAFHARGILNRLGIAERIRLTPESITIEEAKRLTRALHSRGQRIFVLSYHSSSLLPGHTPYVSSAAELRRFLAWLEEYMAFFHGEIGGVPATPLGVHAEAMAGRRLAHPKVAPQLQLPERPYGR